MMRAPTPSAPLPPEATIRQALRDSSILASLTIDVTVADGTVTLSGGVESMDQKEEAERIALRADGIRGVVNLLTVHLFN